LPVGRAPDVVFRGSQRDRKATSLLAIFAARPEEGAMILGHCHVGPPGYFRKIWDRLGEEDGTLEKLDGYLAALGFDRAVVFAPFQRWSDGDPNRWLLDSVRGNRRLIPWATVNEGGRAAVDMILACAQLGARGIKFHPPIIEIAVDDPGLEEFYGLAERMRMPILYHMGPHGWNLDSYRPIRVDAVAGSHPDLPLIVEHLGGAGFAGETMDLMKRHRNVFGGLTTCLPATATWHVPPDTVRGMIRELGPERFMFGSDFPYNSTVENLAALAVLDGFGLSPADRALVLSGNLERIDADMRD
jgi:predicted TIM-barrel fold metal-dependent hydrolase